MNDGGRNRGGTKMIGKLGEAKEVTNIMMSNEKVDERSSNSTPFLFRCQYHSAGGSTVVVVHKRRLRVAAVCLLRTRRRCEVGCVCTRVGARLDKVGRMKGSVKRGGEL